MGRSAVVLLLTLVLGAFVAAHAGGDDTHDDWPRDDPSDKQCRQWQPLRYTTYRCPKCDTNPECIKTECKDGKAKVKIHLRCLFGGNVKFAAVSYKVGKDNVCVNNVNVNKWGKSYSDEIPLPTTFECKELKNHPVELRFVVQDKWWFNPDGKELDASDCCYSKCTHGKPCHTCEFKGIYIKECDKDKCKTPMCKYEGKYDCPKKVEMDKCFKYEPHEHYVKVTMKKDCHKKMKHAACSYKNEKNKDESADHKYSDRDGDDFWFKAACKSKFKWVFEDNSYVNRDKYAPTYPPRNEECHGYFMGGKVCNQCGCDEPVYVGECDKGKHDKEDDQEKGQ